MLRGGPYGVQEWNRWREEGEILPDLSGWNLSRCNLIGADLHGLVFRGAFFGGSELDRANLSGADLTRADMRACRLYYANLSDAILSDANLCSADLGHADLGRADLGHADLTHADLTDTDLRGANLTEADLSFTVMNVADAGDVVASMRRAGRLPLHEEVKDGLFEILQKMDILDDLDGTRSQQVADRVDDLIRELLKSPPNPRRAVSLLDLIGEIAPPLVADVPRRVFLRLRRVN
jgi:uncharacterized protein YjbI with pentapeptide repeats